MTRGEDDARNIHRMGCDCDACEPWRGSARGLTEAEANALFALAGLLLAVVLIEIYAFATGAPHVTVMFGGAA